MFNATLLQAFAAGAALCSTSLGTTFTILGTSGLSTTRLGVVLTSAAMMDDVIGLIMVQVISNLGGDSFDAVTVVRPVMVSLAFAALMPVFGRFVVMPVTAKLNTFREAHPSGKVAQLLRLRQTAFVIHTAFLLGLVVGATFAGTSSLLAAYIAGATISWWDSEVPHVSDQVQSNSPGVENTEERNQSSDNTATDQAAPAMSEQISLPLAMDGGSGMEVYDHYYKTAVEHVLKPFFFVCIQASASRQLLTSIGIYRLFCPHHSTVFWSCGMARHHLHSAHDLQQASLRYLVDFFCKPPSDLSKYRTEACRRVQAKFKAHCPWSPMCRA